MSDKFKLPQISPLMKKAIYGYLGFFTIAMGTLIISHYITQSQELRRAASTDRVDLSINAPASVNVGQEFSVAIIVDRTNTLNVTAADIRLSITPPTAVTLTGITKGNYFAEPNMQVPPPSGNTMGWDTLGTQLYKDLPTMRYAIGALCDYCYLGPSPSPNTPPNNLAQCPANPQCYPKNTTGTLATYTFTANQSGTVNLSFVAYDGTNGTQVAAVSSDVNVSGDLTGDATEILGPPPTACGGADISANGTANGTDGRVNAADYNYLITKWSGFNACP
ncbi:hypothetical protein A2W24_04055 [Microgenomates group bacterium RBG_16_45_19]|nr:MAG: hypothetical protein A2W24_04055 [Microgenomates group bacterium RBG_16_45_19]